MLSSAAARYRDRSHERRADRFARLMRPRTGASVLDLGGGDGSFAARIARRCDVRVVVADIDETRRLAHQHHGFDAVALPADGPIPFDDHAFDIVLCNSVIEHVTLPKEECLHARIGEREWRARAFERQRAFAAEIRRVGRGWFVQTPHRAFPIDAHTWLPFANFLPHEAARRLITVTDRFWVKQCGVADWHLLSPKQMRSLFPGARLVIEDVAGLPKSIIAYRSVPTGPVG